MAFHNKEGKKDFFIFNQNGALAVEECNGGVSRITRNIPQGKEIGRFPSLDSALEIILENTKRRRSL